MSRVDTKTGLLMSCWYSIALLCGKIPWKMFIGREYRWHRLDRMRVKLGRAPASPWSWEVSSKPVYNQELGVREGAQICPFHVVSAMHHSFYSHSERFLTHFQTLKCIQQTAKGCKVPFPIDLRRAPNEGSWSLNLPDRCVLKWFPWGV